MKEEYIILSNSREGALRNAETPEIYDFLKLMKMGVGGGEWLFDALCRTNTLSLYYIEKIGEKLTIHKLK